MKIKVKVHTNSSQEKIEKISDSDYEVWIKEKPVKGKANYQLVKLLKEYFDCREVKIKSGFNSRNKMLEIFDY